MCKKYGPARDRGFVRDPQVKYSRKSLKSKILFYKYTKITIYFDYITNILHNTHRK